MFCTPSDQVKDKAPIKTQQTTALVKNTPSYLLLKWTVCNRQPQSLQTHQVNTFSHCTQKQTQPVTAHKNKHNQSLHTKTNTTSHCTQNKHNQSLHTKTNTTSHCTQKHLKSLHTKTNITSHCTQNKHNQSLHTKQTTSHCTQNKHNQSLHTKTNTSRVNAHGNKH